VISLAAEKNSADVLRMHAERNPEVRDILLQKAKFQETKHAAVTDKNEYEKILNQVDLVLSQVEKELQSHTEGRALTLLRFIHSIPKYWPDYTVSHPGDGWLVLCFGQEDFVSA
jgi:hypothetical protein